MGVDMCEKCKELMNKIEVLETRLSDLEGNVSAITQTSVSLQSRVAMLQDEINLKVSKGDIVSQINISKESARIKGDKIEMGKKL